MLVFFHRFDQNGCHGCIEEAKNLKHELLLRFVTKIQAGGWSLILLSRKPEKQRNATIEHLSAAGYRNWSSLIMRYCSHVSWRLHSFSFFFSSQCIVSLSLLSDHLRAFDDINGFAWL